MSSSISSNIFFVLVFCAFVTSFEIKYKIFQCPDSKDLKTPLTYYDNYLCFSNDNCKFGFGCCNHEIFKHKICLPWKSSLHRKTDDCPPISYKCIFRSKQEYQQKKCFVNSDCKNEEICCMDFCSDYGVCMPPMSKTSLQNEKEGKIVNNYFINNYIYARVENCPRIKPCQNVSSDESVLCNRKDDCLQDFDCCHHGCYSHKVCLKVVEEIGKSLKGIASINNVTVTEYDLGFDDDEDFYRDDVSKEVEDSHTTENLDNVSGSGSYIYGDDEDFIVSSTHVDEETSGSGSGDYESYQQDLSPVLLKLSTENPEEEMEEEKLDYKEYVYY